MEILAGFNTLHESVQVALIISACLVMLKILSLPGGMGFLKSVAKLDLGSFLNRAKNEGDAITIQPVALPDDAAELLERVRAMVEDYERHVNDAKKEEEREQLKNQIREEVERLNITGTDSGGQ